jgi:hypothetical protein
MPAVFVGGKFEGVITLSSKDYPYSEWVDKNLAREREEYEKPNLSLWLEIENKDDPVSALTIPVTNLDVYEGGMKCSQADMKFTFEFNGKAKVNVHKLTKAAIDSGQKVRVTGFSVNGAQQDFENPVEITLLIQSKKLSLIRTKRKMLLKSPIV